MYLQDLGRVTGLLSSYRRPTGTQKSRSTTSAATTTSVPQVLSSTRNLLQPSPAADKRHHVISNCSPSLSLPFCHVFSVAS